MSRIALLLITLTLFIAPLRVEAQDPLKTFSPAQFEVELSSKEPPTIGVASLLDFGGSAGGGGGGSDGIGIHWSDTPSARTRPAAGFFFKACGYPDKENFSVLVAYPDRKVISATSSHFSQFDGCWAYTFAYHEGDELGNYVIAFIHPQKTLFWSWKIDYPTQPFLAWFPRSDTSKTAVLMGFPANKSLKLNFYAFASQLRLHLITVTGVGEYIASRSIQTDPDGAAAIDIQISRSAPFKLEEVALNVDGYLAQGYGLSVAGRTECTSHTLSEDYCLTPFDGSIMHGLQYNEQAVIHSKTGQALLVDPSLSSDAIETLSDGTIVSVIDFMDSSVMSDRGGKGLYWYVKTADGTQGWLFEPGDRVAFSLAPDLTSDTSANTNVVVTCDGFRLASRLSIGTIASVLPGESNVLNTKPSRPSTDPNSQVIIMIPVNDEFKVIGGPQCSDNILWWKVDYQGNIGWTGEGKGDTYWVEPQS